MDTYELIGLVTTVLLTAFFVGNEVAFVSISKLSVELKKKQGSLAGKILSRYLENPSSFLGAGLIGVNIALVVYGLLVSDMMQPFWNWVMPGQQNNPYIRLLVEATLSTTVILLLGEFIPKSFFKAKGEPLLVFLAPLISLFYKMLYPIAAVFVSVAEWVLKYLFNVRISDKKQVFSRVDIDHFIRQSQQHTVENQELNTELFENALYLGNVKIRECMVPRKEIEALEVNSTVENARRKFIDTKLSKLIIYEQNIDSILGYIHQLDLFKNPADIRSMIHPILAVPETMSASDLMSKFTKERKSIAWVVDEFGGTAGIVTMEDVLEEIFGEIQDEYDTEEFVEKQIAENEFIFSGRLEIDYLNEKYHLGLPEEEIETLSGFIIAHHESIPKLKERIIIDDFEFDILNVTETRIEMVKLKLLK